VSKAAAHSPQLHSIPPAQTYGDQIEVPLDNASKSRASVEGGSFVLLPQTNALTDL